MQFTMVSLKIGIVFSISIVVTFGDSNDHALNRYIIFSELGGTILLPCVEKLDKGYKNTNCLWTASDSVGESAPIIDASGSIPVDSRFKIVGDWQNGNCSLQLSSVRKEDKNNYSCTVYPSKHHVAKVQLLIGEKPEYPKIFYERKDVTSEKHVEAKGTNFQLKCVVKKGIPPANISWIFAGFDSNKATTTSQEGVTSSVLTLTSDDMSISDERIIICKAEQPLYPGMNATVNVSIGYPYPIKYVFIRPLTIKVGEQFTCDADGIPRPYEYMWKRKDEQDWKVISGAKSMTFKPDKHGEYRCSAKNILNDGFVQSERDAGVAATVEEDVIAKEGDSLFLPCRDNAGKLCVWAASYPDGSSDIVAMSNNPYPKPRYHLTDSPQIGDCSLNITDIESSDRGRLTCTIKPNPPYPIKYNVIVGSAVDK